jgi:phosphoenolpyruvate-protein kinase (PTS system EI component)
VDGSAGVVYIDPGADFVVPRQHAPAVERDSDQSSLPLPPGLPRLEVNVNLLSEVEAVRRQGAPGVGLYRSEFLFLARRTLPTEEEQFGIYRKLLTQLGGRPVSIRTFDLRPDKLKTYSQMSSMAVRPFDWRLVVESPPLQQLFREQIRAILRASAPDEDEGRVGPVRILVPLVTRSEILDFVLQTLAEARAALKEEGTPFAPEVELGVMIEVAAAAGMVENWAEQVDFFALGTNDLTASALGLDRDDPVEADQCDSLHPGLLRMIHDIVQVAHSARKPVTVCGEMAADPEGCLALCVLQVDSISVPVTQYRTVRRTLARLSAGRLRDLSPELLRTRTATGARALLRKTIEHGK